MSRLILFLLLISFMEIFAQDDIDPENIYTFYFDGVKYEVIKEKRTWEEAALIAYNRGGILAQIYSQEEQDSIYSNLNKAGIVPSETVAADGGDGSYLWIGGNDRDVEGRWIWDGADDGIGEQFWEGNKVFGNPVNGLYNNWGQEPDDANGQDALGLAISNWPKGHAGQWNDVDILNSLYFIVEYNNSSIYLNKTRYNHKSNTMSIDFSLPLNLDSLQVIIDTNRVNSILNVTVADTTMSFIYESDSTSYAGIQFVGFYEDKIYASRVEEQLILSFNNPVTSYETDFDDNPVDSFIGKNFTIKREVRFRNNAIHSLHDYPISSNNFYTLIKPIIVNEENPVIEYSDIAIVEPGEPGSQFGDNNFKDYVVVEASKDADTWTPLLGYDASYDNDWENAWNSPTNVAGFYKKHTITLTNTFSPGDTILIRFRLFSDETNTGWGWAIDSLNIQGLVSSVESKEEISFDFSLAQNYPNPFNPSTKIEFSIPKQSFVTLKVYDVLGREISRLVNKEIQAGRHSVNFDASALSTGVYFYKIEAGNFVEIKKMSLIK